MHIIITFCQVICYAKEGEVNNDLRQKEKLLCAYNYVILFDNSFLSYLRTFQISSFIKNQEFRPPADKKVNLTTFVVRPQFIR